VSVNWQFQVCVLTLYITTTVAEFGKEIELVNVIYYGTFVLACDEKICSLF